MQRMLILLGGPNYILLDMHVLRRDFTLTILFRSLPVSYRFCRVRVVFILMSTVHFNKTCCEQPVYAEQFCIYFVYIASGNKK